MLKIEQLTKMYSKNKLAVDGLTLEVKPGELCGFIGHNGAGKTTTTLRAVAGILSFDSGQITVAGHDIVKEPVAAKKAMAFLPDKVTHCDF